MDAIKLEGGAPSRISAAKHIVEAGIAVMGHVGLTPQAISVLGGFRAQGKNVLSALKVQNFTCWYYFSRTLVTSYIIVSTFFSTFLLRFIRTVDSSNQNSFHIVPLSLSHT